MSDPMLLQVTLQTTMLDEQRQFYTQVLEFPLLESNSEGFVIQVGASKLSFQAVSADEPRLYHFAIDIPENQIQEALAWTRSRVSVEVNPSAEDDVFEFLSWDAHAFYWLDPEGNIGEFISRHSTPSASTEPFDSTRALHVSELGVVTRDVAATCKQLIDHLGLACYPDPSAEPGSEFQAMGSQEGLFVVVKEGRTWLGGKDMQQHFRRR